MKRTRCRADSPDLPRKHATAIATSLNSSWEDVDSDSDAKNVDTELRQHEENLNAFVLNVQSFLHELRNSVIAKAATGKVTVAAANVSLKVIIREMESVMHQLNNRPPTVTKTPTDTASSGTAVDETMARTLDAQEASVDVLYERVVHEFGFPSPLPPNDGCPIAPSPTPQASTIIDVSSSPPGTVATSSSSPQRSNATGIGQLQCEKPDDELPTFLTTLKRKYDGGGSSENWCRGCNALASLVPPQWSDSFHQTLHKLRSAMPPPSIFEGYARAMRTVTAGRPQAYGVLRIDPDRYNDGPMRKVREYVNAELGVSERGVRPYSRFAYLSIVLRRRDGAAMAVIGYLEAEPVTAAAYPLGTDGRLWPDRRRPVAYGVSRLWVAVGYRRRRVGTNMLDAFRADHSLRCCDIAFAAHEIQYSDRFVRHYIASAVRGQEDDSVFIYTHSSAWYR